MTDQSKVPIWALSDTDLYDLIVEAVGDETSLEFCALTEWLIDGNDLDLVCRAWGMSASDLRESRKEIERLAAEKDYIND